MQGGGNPRELKRLKGHPLTTADANLYLRPSHRPHIPCSWPQNLTDTGAHNMHSNVNAHSNIYPSTRMGTHTQPDLTLAPRLPPSVFLRP